MFTKATEGKKNYAKDRGHWTECTYPFGDLDCKIKCEYRPDKNKSSKCDNLGYANICKNMIAQDQCRKK